MTLQQVDSVHLSADGTAITEDTNLPGLECQSLAAAPTLSQHHQTEILELMPLWASLLMSWPNQSLILSSRVGTTTPALTTSKTGTSVLGRSLAQSSCQLELTTTSLLVLKTTWFNPTGIWRPRLAECHKKIWNNSENWNRAIQFFSMS